MKYFQQVLFVIISAACLNACISSVKTMQLTKIQLLQDNINGVDGLDNARIARITPDGSQVLVASADDDALAVFDIDENFVMTFRTLFKNNADLSGFVGATKMVLTADAQKAFLVSFYDSAIVIFTKDSMGDFQYQQTISDNLKWFNDTGEPILISEEFDKLALLGAYDIAITPDNQKLLVASSASNALSVFNLDANHRISIDQTLRDSQNTDYALTSAVSVIAADNNIDVFVASYEENAVTIFSRADTGKLVFSQTLRNDQIESPHSLAISADSQFLYVACMQSVVVFRKGMNAYTHLQTVNIMGSNLAGMAGASGIALTPNNEYVFVTAENEGALAIFSRAADGKLKFHSLLKEPELEGASSVTISHNGKHVLVTAGNEGNSLSIYEIN
ncbi:MAG: DNA-binding beta-propeller fold protein YncE [Paraglaciecola sp.]|jgi:DNA-binding beta-propeller fold protein YncE